MDETDAEPWLLRPPSGARVIDTGAARWWSEGRILCNQSYVAHVTATDLRSGFRAAHDLTDGRRAPLVAESGPLTETDREARLVLAGPEAAAVFSAMAVVVRSPVARVILSLFVRLQSPPFPLRIFDDAALARAWAHEQADRA